MYASQKKQVSADDAKNKRGFAMNILNKDNKIHVIVDGNSLSINQTAQYLIEKHKPNHELSKEEAKNEVLKAEGIHSAYCEGWALDGIIAACEKIVTVKSALEKEPKTLTL